jgi:hypothetical protein
LWVEKNCILIYMQKEITGHSAFEDMLHEMTKAEVF